MITYDEMALRTSTEKTILCHVEPSERLVVFTLDSGSIYKRTMNHFVINFQEDGVELVKGSSSTLNAGEWYYNQSTGVLYVRSSDSLNPNTHQNNVTYRLFFANSPINLPYDLSTGTEVEYESRFVSSSSIVKELDPEQLGIALESRTTVNLLNQDLFFDDTFDTLVWENKRIGIYSYFLNTVISVYKRIFEGIIQDKSYGDSKISFSCQDYLFKLREPVQQERFTTSDGSVPDSILGSAKRRIYGRLKQLQVAPVDATLGGYDLTGTISGDALDETITGVGTSFLSELSPRDTVSVVFENETITLEVDSVTSDTSFEASDILERTFRTMPATNKPDRPYRIKNRSWNIAGHKLRAPATTITAINFGNRIEVASSIDIFKGDLIDIGGTEDRFVKRVSGNEIVLESVLQLSHSVSDAVTKNPVDKVFIGTRESFINRDWTVSNGASDAVLTFNTLAEFNVAESRNIVGSFVFTNGSRTVTATSVNLLDFLRPRDWIKNKEDLTHQTWYEILSVEAGSLTLRVPYAGATDTTTANIKNPELIDDDTIITVDTMGLERDGEWVKTGPDAVKDMIENDIALTNVNSTSFSNAAIEAPYILAMAMPTNIGGDAIQIKTAVTRINESIFGSLSNNNDFEITYDILTPERPADMVRIFQDDLSKKESYSSNNEIVRKVNATYSPFVDIFTGENTTETASHTNTFVDNFVGIKNEKDVDLLLFEESAAEIITQRYALYNSLSQSVITLPSKMRFSLFNLNQKIDFSLDRLYKRLGGASKRKVGIVNKIVKNGLDATVSVNDLSNVFNRVGAIADNAALEFSSATENEKIKNCYIVDDTTETPDTSSDVEINTNLIG